MSAPRIGVSRPIDPHTKVNDELKK